jgi:hypothetical protein
MTHPWRRLRALTHINLLWHDDGPMGETDFVAGTISLRRGLNQAELRSTILHECLHVERGPVPMGLAPKEEHQVRKLAAQQLLPQVTRIGDALAWAQGDLAAAAEELWVDEGTLRDRLRFMTHPTERRYLARRLEGAKEWT